MATPTTPDGAVARREGPEDEPAPRDAEPARGPRTLFRELERPRDVVANIGPNWFASIMGTGIVANAAILLPKQVPGQHGFALGVWVVAASLLVVMTLAFAAHWLLHRETAGGHHQNPAMAPFYGAPPMAAMTVGAGALLVGEDLIGEPAAVVVAFALWTLGTVGGLATAVAIPYWLFTRHEIGPKDAFAGWLMPLVPPMGSAATGAALIAHLPDVQAQRTMLLGCYAMFGLSLMASIVTITILWNRMAHQGTGPSARRPTLFIVLGPLGQSITAAGLLGDAAPSAIGGPYDRAFEAFAVVYGVPVWGFAALWLALATALVVRSARDGMPFSLTWWSFTFPVGTLVTGTSGLARHTGLEAFAWAAVGLYVLLLLAWVTAASRTAHGSVRTGRLLRPA